jgi:serine/threonine protein kinase
MYNLIKSKYQEYAESIRKLGRGSFGEVYKLKKGEEEIAVKIVDLSKYDNVFDVAQKWLEYSYQELIVSNFVIKVRESQLDKTVLYIEMEYARGGTLMDLIDFQKSKKKLLSLQDVWILFLFILEGINGISNSLFILFLIAY